MNDNTVAITGGSVGIIRSKGNSAVSISGGSVGDAYGFNSGTVNISGGTVNNTTAFNSSAFRISGGTLTSGVHLYGTSATANFVGTGLGFAYQSSGTNNQYGEFADFFNVTGTIGGVAKTIGVTIYNQGSANSAARQFTFNGAAPTPVVVPEAGTLALFGAGLAVFGAVIVRQRK